jgi:hypothetical protein
MVLIDLFDKQSRAESALLSIKKIFLELRNRVTIRTLFGLYLFFGGAFAIVRKMYPHALSSTDATTNAILPLIMMAILAIPLLAVMLFAWIHIAHAALVVLNRHPKGILGSAGLILTVAPDLASLIF